LRSLPDSVCRLNALKRLYLDSNQLEVSGLPEDLGLLPSLELFSASDNKLETIPDSFAKCTTLKRLLLNDNRINRLPKGIQFLPKIEAIETRGNGDFTCPPKPNPTAVNNAYYNIDFSLQNQLKIASAASGASVHPSVAPSPHHSSSQDTPGSLSKQSSLDAGSSTSLGKKTSYRQSAIQFIG